MKIFLNLGDRKLFATLERSEAARQFAAMLPMKITMYDFCKREKFGPLNNSLAFHAAPTRTKRYGIGDIICWVGGLNLAIFYRQDGKVISGAFHMLGRIESGAEAFGQQGPLEVQIDRVTQKTKVSHSTTVKRSPAHSLPPKLP